MRSAEASLGRLWLAVLLAFGLPGSGFQGEPRAVLCPTANSGARGFRHFTPLPSAQGSVCLLPFGGSVWATSEAARSSPLGCPGVGYGEAREAKPSAWTSAAPARSVQPHCSTPSVPAKVDMEQSRIHKPGEKISLYKSDTAVTLKVKQQGHPVTLRYFTDSLQVLMRMFCGSMNTSCNYRTWTSVHARLGPERRSSGEGAGLLSAIAHALYPSPPGATPSTEPERACQCPVCPQTKHPENSETKYQSADVVNHTMRHPTHTAQSIVEIQKHFFNTSFRCFK